MQTVNACSNRLARCLCFITLQVCSLVIIIYIILWECEAVSEIWVFSFVQVSVCVYNLIKTNTSQYKFASKLTIMVSQQKLDSSVVVAEIP